MPYSSRETYPDSRKDMANISKIQIKTKKQAVIKGQPFKKSKIIPTDKHYINKVKSKKKPKIYIFTFFYSEKFAGLQKSSIFASQFSKTLVATLNNGALDEWLSLWSAKPATAVRIRQAPRWNRRFLIVGFIFYYISPFTCIFKKLCATLQINKTDTQICSNKRT